MEAQLRYIPSGQNGYFYKGGLPDKANNGTHAEMSECIQF